jgi:hypothetical protein
MSRTAARGQLQPSLWAHRQRVEQLQADSWSHPALTPLYIPCLQPLQLCSGSSSSNNKMRCVPLAPLASPTKRVSAKRKLRCSRQLFSPDASRSAAMQFWLQAMEQVSGVVCCAGSCVQEASQMLKTFLYATNVSFCDLCRRQCHRLLTVGLRSSSSRGPQSHMPAWLQQAAFWQVSSLCITVEATSRGGLDHMRTGDGGTLVCPWGGRCSAAAAAGGSQQDDKAVAKTHGQYICPILWQEQLARCVWS